MANHTVRIGLTAAYNVAYSYDVPASAFVAGTNTLVISAVSGTAGSGFLSPGFAYDALDML